MKFATALVKKSELWLGCAEERANRSACVDEIHVYYNGKVTAEAWCAKFVYMITDLCAKDFGIKNLLPRTASTLTMVNTAPKNRLRVDTIPAPGSIFFKTRTGGGHVGIVKAVEGSTIITVEGNKNNKVEYGKHSNTAGYKFIHTEEMPKLNGKADEGFITFERPTWLYSIGTDLLLDNNFMYGVAAAGLIGAGYYVYKNL